MVTYEELRIKIEELDKTDFNYHKEEVCDKIIYISSLLRKALLYNNSIYYLKNKQQKKELYQKLDAVLEYKFIKLNPNFDDNIRKSMVSCHKRGPYQYPIDIFVIGDAVFAKEGVFDDFGSLYKIQTFMIDATGKYHNIYNYISFNSQDIMHSFEKDRFRTTVEENKKISKFISTNINEALMSKYQCNVTKPQYEMNTKHSYSLCDSIIPDKIHGINIYLDKKYVDIAKNILNKCECDIKMYVQDDDDIEMYVFHQTLKDNEPIWEVEKKEFPIWKLSEEAMKKEQKHLTKKKIIVGTN